MIPAGFRDQGANSGKRLCGKISSRRRYCKVVNSLILLL